MSWRDLFVAEEKPERERKKTDVAVFPRLSIVLGVGLTNRRMQTESFVSRTSDGWKFEFSTLSTFISVILRSMKTITSVLPSLSLSSLVSLLVNELASVFFSCLINWCAILFFFVPSWWLIFSRVAAQRDRVLAVDLLIGTTRNWTTPMMSFTSMRQILSRTKISLLESFNRSAPSDDRETKTHCDSVVLLFLFLCLVYCSSFSWILFSVTLSLFSVRRLLLMLLLHVDTHPLSFFFFFIVSSLLCSSNNYLSFFFDNTSVFLSMKRS